MTIARHALTKRATGARLGAALAVVVLSHGLVSGEENDLRTVSDRATSAYKAGKWAEAGAGFREAARLAEAGVAADPGNHDLAETGKLMAYNAACCASREGKVDAAVALLEDLIRVPWFDNDDMLATDPDLDAVRKDPRFQDLRGHAQAVLARAASANVEGRILLPARLATSGVPAIVALHGGGGSVESFAAPWQTVANRTGAVIILVRGSLVQDRGVFSYNQKNTAADRKRIDDWLARARREVPAIDPNRLYLAGFSQGGGMAWVLARANQGGWRGFIPISGYVQVALREAVLGDPPSATSVYAIVGASDEPAIDAINRKLTGQAGLKNLRSHLEVSDGAHALPPNLPQLVRQAMAWCEAKEARGS